MIIGDGVNMIEVKSHEKYSKGYKIFFYETLILCVCFLFVYGVFGALLLLITIIILIAWMYSSFCRVLIFDETGCTIKCWILERKYSWEELKYIRYYKKVPKTKVPSRKRVVTWNGHGIEFSTKPIKRKTLPEHYIQAFPFKFTYFFVTFPHKPTPYKKDYLETKRRGDLLYHVEDQIGFIEQLKKWGVDIDVQDMYVATWDK